MAVWREGTTNAEAADVIDNATALTTSLRLHLPSASPNGASCRLRPEQEQKKAASMAA
jgi:hypothetical protein